MTKRWCESATIEPTTMAPITIPPTTKNSIAITDKSIVSECPWLANTGVDNLMECVDGSRCNGKTDGWSCCNSKGGRARCPVNLKEMCEEKTGCGGGKAHCCESSCAFRGMTKRWCESASGNWKLLFKQDNSARNADTFLHIVLSGTGTESDAFYSALQTLDDTYKNADGKFHFKIVWSELNSAINNYNEWQQSSNPGTSSVITDFQPITLNYSPNTVNSFAGLGLNKVGSRSRCVIDDKPMRGSGWCCIGAMSKNKFRGPYNQMVRKVMLYVWEAGQDEIDNYVDQGNQADAFAADEEAIERILNDQFN